MHARDPIQTTLRGRLARRFPVALALALWLTVAVAGAALASPGHASGQRPPAPAAAAARTANETAVTRTAANDRPSRLIPLVFAGILFLAASPALPRTYSRYGYFRGERW